METINFGIDLGTTNSLIARFVKGHVEIFKNPSGFKDSLPSVVAYRKDRIIVGEKAREYQEKDPANVVGRFKRKMGTSEEFKIKSLSQTRTPVDLSAEVLKELKGFVHTGKAINSAVITIPASFDTIQCNATKQAAEQSGLKHVILLQEPIAASLAYANKRKEKEMPEGKWLVYDLGGGTFDVALVQTQDGELKILDHEGDNFLGGVDFDSLIVEKLIVPKLEKAGVFADLANQMKSAEGKYSNLWARCLHKAEEAKVELSSKLSAEVEIETKDDLDDDIDIIIQITRSDFEDLIKETVDRTVEMIRTILTRKNLSSKDLNFVLMVGGSTFIPLVKQRVGELLNIEVVTEIDPTTAIVVGAAFFAGTQQVPSASKEESSSSNSKFSITAAYSTQTRDLEIPFAAKVEGDFKGLNYRIVRADGGFDSGVKPLASRIFEDLPLEQDAFNVFEFKTTDATGNSVENTLNEIQVAHGKYSVAGQTLPQDICIEIDSADVDGVTTLECIFSRNSLLPAKKKRTAPVSRTLIHGAHGDAIRIIVREGPSESGPESAKEIGTLLITGGQITRDVPKGTDIDLVFEMSESRDIKVEAYINATGQNFGQVFNPKARVVGVSNLGHHLTILQQRIESELDEATENEQYETAKELKRIESSVLELGDKAAALSDSDVTDERYKLEDRKMELAQQIDRLTSDKRILAARREYEQARDQCDVFVDKHGSDRDRFKLDQIKAQEMAFMKAANPKTIQHRTDELKAILYGILMKLPDFLIRQFESMVRQSSRLNDEAQASLLIEAGRRSIQSQDFDKLRVINAQLIDLLPEEKQEEARSFTGIY